MGREIEEGRRRYREIEDNRMGKGIYKEIKEIKKR